ncbi:MAG: hypothetical protein HKN37_03925 [Rhodothermales bacterium]|nr:hypothetical protein [Rhodothermales bacterium]
MSIDKKASVLFPDKPDKTETVSRKSPAGTIRTNIQRYEREGALLTINGTTLPRAALRFAGEKKILGNAAEGVLGKYYGKKVSEKRTTIDGAPAVVLDYRVPDYDDKDHPGYRGTAIALLVDDRLYVVNSILTKENPKAKAMQQKLLGSIRVHK